ncbi:hypothetical protein NP493_576g03011 [Ridgeia piscesae]|uniref:Uncharacterized protein n=1 Tax=Ridgeia piscesae TaxID=27915 RepID=A0AAD9NPR2_RIDPI|nr:hypothetical protein NP493_576g03011 [Ridgeia piscesae]
MRDRMILVGLATVIYMAAVTAEPTCECKAKFTADVDCPIAYEETYPGLQRLTPDPCNCSCFFTCQQLPYGRARWRATRRCCAPCLLWDQDLKTCIRGPDCGHPKPVPTPQQPGACPLRPVEGKPTKFRHGRFVKTCSPGTVFDVVKCTCVHSAVKGVKATAPKLMTCFTFDKNSVGLFGEWAMYQNVKIVSEGCIHGRCVLFPGDGPSRIEIPLFAGMFGSSAEMSLSFWYKKEEDDMVGILGNGGCERRTMPSIYVLGLYQGFIQGAMFSQRRKVAYGATTVPDNVWHHVVLTSDGHYMVMYVDGQSVSKELLKGQCRLHQSQLPLVLGSQPCTDKFLLGHFKGKMDQLCVYKSALSPAEVTTLYSHPGMTKLQ